MNISLVRVVVAFLAGAAVMVPAVLVEMAEDRGGLGEVDNFDFLGASAMVAVGAAIVAAVVFDRAVARGYRRGDVMVAAVDGVVATLSAAVLGLVGFLLLHVREQHALGEGVGVELATWSSVHVLSVAIGLAASRAALRWLARSPQRDALPHV